MMRSNWPGNIQQLYEVLNEVTPPPPNRSDPA